jgi:hypothetical protein
VDVGGVVIAENEDPFFIAGILNSQVVNFVFRRISKPFRGNYLSANKQFIAPLPIPNVSNDDREAVASKARGLQAAHTMRRDILTRIERRLSTARTRSRPETWLFVGLKSERELVAVAPTQLDAEMKRAWAKQRYTLDLGARFDAISSRVLPGTSLSVTFNEGELSVAADGVPIVDHVFVDATDGEFILAQWKLLTSTFVITEKTDGKKLANALRKLVVPDNPALVEQIIALEAELSKLEASIDEQEVEMNSLINRLCELTEADIRMVAKG